MTQAVTAKQIQEAGGLDKWAAKQARNPVPPSKAINHGGGTSPNSNARGRLPDNKSIGYGADRMNKLETKYAEYLEAQKRAGVIILWRYESVKFRLAGKTWYTPDFYILSADGSIEIHETKGHWEDDARVKIKATAAQFPELLFKAIQLVKGEWAIEMFNQRGM